MKTLYNNLSVTIKNVFASNPEGNRTDYFYRVQSIINRLKEKISITFISTVSIVAALLALVLIYIQYIVPTFIESAFLLIPGPKSNVVFRDTLTINKLKEEYKKSTGLLEGRMKQISKSPYIVINSTRNEFKLYAQGNAVREGKCSTGSYVKLEYKDNQRWVFRTPKGMLKIKGKTKDPVWKKPDWAFIEEGKPVPSPNHSSRFEYGVLGDYSLALGDGYLIHGTLYQRLLGMPVTHGCVRLGDDDLEAVFRTLRIGDRVFIY